MDLEATQDQVWQAWTTEAGVRSFFAPECKIEMQPGGAYEMYFNLDAPQGSRGGEGLVILAVQPPQMLSFTWNAPPELAEVRSQRTHVTIRLEAIGESKTRLHFCEDGFGQGDQWQQRLEYFRRTWGQVVLPRLAYRFEHGPLDWENLPDLSQYLKRVYYTPRLITGTTWRSRSSRYSAATRRRS